MNIINYTFDNKIKLNHQKNTKEIYNKIYKQYFNKELKETDLSDMKD